MFLFSQFFYCLRDSEIHSCTISAERPDPVSQVDLVGQVSQAEIYFLAKTVIAIVIYEYERIYLNNFQTYPLNHVPESL